jgi:membrane protein implicated in regulation of membrane protease activity
MDASQILVAILATTLAIFLVLAIILVVVLIRVARQIQRVTSTAERVAANFENIVGSVQKAVAPAVVSRFVMDQIQRFTDRQNKRDKKD